MATIDQMFDDLKISFDEIVRMYESRIATLKAENTRLREKLITWGRIILSQPPTFKGQ